MEQTKAEFVQLHRYDRYGFDFETTGIGFNDYPVSAGLALPDGRRFYYAWGHPTGNNCTLKEFLKWAKAEMCDPFYSPKQSMILYNGVFDLRMGRNIGIKPLAIVEDPGIAASLLNEYDMDMSLEGRAEKYVGEIKLDKELNEWCARAFGGKPTRDDQAGNYHKAPGHLVGPYVAQDAGLTLGVHDATQPLIMQQDLFPIYWVETMVIPVLVKMYFAGVRVDLEKAQKTRTMLLQEEGKLQVDLDKLTGWARSINVSSGKDLAELFDQLKLPYPKTKEVKKRRTRTTKKYKEGDEYISGGNPSFKKEFLDSLDHPVGKLVRNRRKVGHYANTFIRNYILNNADEFGFIHPNFWQVRSAYGGTITGRFSSSGGLNAQNIPARDDVYAPLIRSMFIPISDEHQWLKADYSQIEYRLFAHYAKGKMVEAFQKDPLIDFHDLVAQMTGLQRKAAKSINFAKLYGAGPQKLAYSIGCSLEEAIKFIKTYERAIPESKTLYDKAMLKGQRRGYVKTIGGRINRFRYGSETTRDGRVRKGYMSVHTALNKILQGSSADLTKMAMIAVDQYIDWDECQMHLTVHDELDFSVPKGARGTLHAQNLREIMESQLELRVPIICEAELGPDWGHVVEGSVPRTDGLVKKKKAA